MMWARLCEIALGLWLIASPWVLSQEGVARALVVNEIVCGGLCIALAAIACGTRFRYAHLLEIPVALWLAGFAYFTSESPATAAAQSDVLTAFFLVNLAIIPTRATDPPPGWVD